MGQPVLLDAVVSGGLPPYSFRWSPGGQTTEDITVSAAGTYRLTVTSANGCAISDSVRVREAGGGSLMAVLLGALTLVTVVAITLLLL